MTLVMSKYTTEVTTSPATVAPPNPSEPLETRLMGETKFNTDNVTGEAIRKNNNAAISDMIHFVREDVLLSLIRRRRLKEISKNVRYFKEISKTFDISFHKIKGDR
jgi:hypothetical protein